MSETRMARKPHYCTLCARTIRPGERYAYQRVTPWDHPDNDGFFDYRAHVRCDAFWLAEWAPEHDWCFSIGDELDFRRECWRYHVRKRRAETATPVAA